MPPAGVREYLVRSSISANGEFTWRPLRVARRIHNHLESNSGSRLVYHGCARSVGASPPSPFLHVGVALTCGLIPALFAPDNVQAHGIEGNVTALVEQRSQWLLNDMSQYDILYG